MTQPRTPSSRPDPYSSTAGQVRVFLSYGRRDGQELAERLRDSLAGHFDVWQDQQRIRIAHNWDEEIEAAIRHANVVVFLMTPHSVREARTSADRKSSVSRDELAYARDHDVPIIPVRVTPSDTPLLIHRLQQIDFHQWNESDAAYEAGVTRIAASIQLVASRQSVPERTWHGLPTPYNFEPLMRAKLQHFAGRQWLFDEIQAWLDKGIGHALLVVGDPGAGKSAAAAAMVRDNAGGRVLAYHFCDYATPETTNPATFVRSLVALLSARLDGYERMVADPEIGRALARADDDPASAFESVVLGLLGKVPAPKDGSRFILIDALDESLVRDRPPTIVDVLSARLDRLPRWLKIVATTRRDPPVMERLKGLRGFTVDAQDPRTRGDVERFIKERLRDPLIRQQIGPSSREIDAAAKRLLDASEGNFLAASTALEAVREGLMTMAEAEGLSPKMESRFQMFFARMFPQPDDDFSDARRLLQVVVASQEPLVRSELSSVLASGDDDDALTRVLRRLSSFVPGTGGRFKLVHKTLGDWLTGEIDGHPKAGEYAANPARGHELLADWCWRQWENGPSTCSDYCVRHLPMHLVTAGRTADVQQLLFDLEWMRVKLARTDVSTLLADYQLLGTEASRRVSVTVAAGMAADDRLAYVLAQQLLARLPADGIPELETLREHAAQAVMPPALRSRFPTMALTGLLAVLERAPVNLKRLTLAPDGRFIHGVSANRKQHHWDARSGKALSQPDIPTASFRGSPKPAQVRRDRPARKAAKRRGRGSNVAASGALDDALAVASSADGTRMVASWRDGMLGAFHAADPASVRKTKGHHYGCEFAQFLDGDRFATYLEIYAGVQPQGEAKVWDFQSLGTLPSWPSHLDWVRTVAFFPDGEHVASVSTDNSLQVWDHATGRVRRSARVTWRSVGAVAVSPDSKWILTGDRGHLLGLWDRTAGGVRVWSTVRWDGEGEPRDLGELPRCYCINAVAFTRDPDKAVIAADGLYEVNVGDAYRRLAPISEDLVDTLGRDAFRLPAELGIAFEAPSPELYCLAIAPDDSIVIAGGGGLRDDPRDSEILHVWDLRTRRLLFHLHGHERGVTGVAIVDGPDGRQVVSSSGDGTVISWDLERRQPARVLRGHAGVVRGVALTRDGRHIVSAGTDHTLRLWDAATGQELSRFTGDAGFSALAIGPGGHLVAGDMAGHVHFFDPVGAG